MAWVLLLASAGAVLVTGLVATALVFGGQVPSVAVVPRGFWARLVVASGLTLSSLGLRALRWVYLLRRAETRIPIRDAYIGYLAGFSLLLAPLLTGEIAVRAWVLRRRGRIPSALTATLTIWERGFDVLALTTIASGLMVVTRPIGAAAAGIAGLAAVAAFLLVRPVRAACLSSLLALVNHVGRVLGRRVAGPLPRLLRPRTCVVLWVTSTVAWILPALGFWVLGRESHAVPALESAHAFAASTLRGGLWLAPGGVVVAGTDLLAWLAAHGFDASQAALAVLGARLGTAGVATALGAFFVGLHLRAPQPVTGDHFDAIADAYDVQIAEARRLALVERKTRLMAEWLERHGVGRRGLDVGCGQGWYVGRMREMGLDVTGIDTSAEQVALAARHLRDDCAVRVGSALAVPAPDEGLDFAYTINVLHHLPSTDAQQAAFAEVLRVLKPGGVLFLHEINTTNPLFRFYMGYVFPSLNCIDEGVERWLLPRELGALTPAPVVEVQYFTFFPDFMPQTLVRWLAPVERWLEQSALRSYSAHYMAVLRKPAC